MDQHGGRRTRERRRGRKGQSASQVDLLPWAKGREELNGKMEHNHFKKRFTGENASDVTNEMGRF